MRHLDLFSGIGGFALAAQWAGMQTVGFSEIDEFACKVLAKNFPQVPNLGNIKEIKGNECGTVDIITGGYPCQPFSSIGARQGHKDPRHLWPEMFRIIKNARPNWVLCENVERHVSMGLDSVLSDLEKEGYETRAFIIPACAVGAPHERKRVWVVANSEGFGKCGKLGSGERKAGENEASWGSSDGESFRNNAGGANCGWCGRGEFTPRVRGMADGIPKRVDRARLKALGNAIVPQVAYEILSCIAEIESKPNRVIGGK